MPVELTIAKKRLLHPTEKAQLITTSGYGGSVFSLPFSQILETTIDTSIKINDVHDEPAITYLVTDWIYEKNKTSLEKMYSHHIIIKKGKKYV